MEAKSPWLGGITGPAISLLLGTAVAAVVFAIDTITPLQVGVAILYVPVVLIAASFLPRPGILLVSAGCLVLTIASYLLTHRLDEGMALGRAFLGMAAIGITTFLALKNQSANAVLSEQARLLDLTHDTVFVRDMNDVITYWNRGAEDMYGWTRTEAVGKVCHDFLQTTFPLPLEEIMTEVLRTGRWEGELVQRRRDGSKVTVESRWSLKLDQRSRPAAILETNTNITGRKRADAELRENERRYRNIFQTAGVSIWEDDFSLVKAALDELRAEGVSDFAAYFAAHPEFVRKALSLVRIVDVNDATVRLLGGESREEILGPLGRIFLPETEAAFAGALLALAEGRGSFESESVLRTLKGEVIAVLVAITFPADTAGLERVLVSVMDITGRNRTEEALRKAEATLAHVTRVTTLGELVASIAHEVNQPLAAIVISGQACLRWLNHDPPALDEVRGAVERMVRDGRRAGDVILRLRALSKKGEPEKLQLAINDVIEDVLLLVQREVASHRVWLRLELAPALPPVLGDRVQLQQVIINLVINAIQSMAQVSDRPRELVLRSSRHEADQVLVTVRDSGVGIAPNDMDRLFSAFFSTRPDGMGMGLSICRSIIEAHGGAVWTSSDGTPGATFQFTLPAAAEPR